MDREEFEKRAKLDGFDTAKWTDEPVDFKSLATGCAWKGWQARQPEIDALRAEVERLRKDAERYRYLKDNALIDWAPSDGVAMVIPEPSTGRNWKADVDDAIDAMKETK